MKKYIFSVFVFYFLGTLFSVAQGIDQKLIQLNTYFTFLNNAGFSGQILVAEKGRVLDSKVFGFANKETKYPISSTTAINIASLTKQFTAAAILWLEQSGKLKTTDSLGVFWNTLAPEKKSITIHHLLSHTSGFKRQVVPSNVQIGKDELLKQIFLSELISMPGKLFRYSNAGYEILAAIIEKVSGLSYKEFIHQKFIIPNKLEHTFFDTDDIARISQKIAFGYNEWKQVSNSINPKTNWNNTGAGNLLSTAEDLYKLFSLITTNKILNQYETNKLFTAAVKAYDDEEYGYGWFLYQDSDRKKLIYHGGDLTGFHAEFRYFPDDNRIIIVLSNQEVFRLGVFKYRIASALNKILSGNPVEFPKETKQPHIDSLYKYCGTYRLDSANSIKIWQDGERLKVGVWGQLAVNLLGGKATANKYKLDSISEVSKKLIHTLINEDVSMAEKLITPEEYKSYYSLLQNKYKDYFKAMDGNPSFSVGGTIPAYWNGEEFFRTYVKLKFATGECNFYLGWGPKGIHDVTINDDRPFSLIYTILFRDENQFLVYDLDNAFGTDIYFKIDLSAVVTALEIIDNKGVETSFGRVFEW